MLEPGSADDEDILQNDFEINLQHDTLEQCTALLQYLYGEHA
jgi:hypothetical protein